MSANSIVCKLFQPAYGATIRNSRPPVRRAMNSAVIFAPNGIAP
jgi:hypothetical protein